MRQEEKKSRAEARRLLYVACTRARDLLIVPRPPLDAALGAFWKELVDALPQTSDAACGSSTRRRWRGRTRRGAGGSCGRSRAPRAATPSRLAGRASVRSSSSARRSGRYRPVSATRLVERTAPPPVATVSASGGRDFGNLVHRLLEWVPLDDTDAARAGRVRAMALALAPSFGLGEGAAHRAGEQVERVLSMPLVERARRAPRVWRELPLWFPDGAYLVEGQVDLVFEEDGKLVVVDYKSDAIADEQALEQAAHHAPQLQLYGRGLTQAIGLAVRERLVVFTALAAVFPSRVRTRRSVLLYWLSRAGHPGPSTLRRR